MQNLTNYYSVGKKKVSEYIKQMENRYLHHLQTIDMYESELFEESDEFRFLQENIDIAQKFVRTWDTLNELSPVDKNMLLCFSACDRDYDETLKIFNGIKDNKVKNKKNLASLRMAICRARKKLIDKYTEKYGND